MHQLQARTTGTNQALFDELDTLYSESTRFYHDKTHVAECLTNFQVYRAQTEYPAEIEVAIWYHDAIYDTKQIQHRYEAQARTNLARKFTELSAQ